MALKAQLEPAYYLSRDTNTSHVYIRCMAKSQWIPTHLYELVGIPFYNQGHEYESSGRAFHKVFGCVCGNLCPLSQKIIFEVRQALMLDKKAWLVIGLPIPPKCVNGVEIRAVNGSICMACIYIALF